MCFHCGDIRFRKLREGATTIVSWEISPKKEGTCPKRTTKCPLFETTKCPLFETTKCLLFQTTMSQKADTITFSCPLFETTKCPLFETTKLVVSAFSDYNVSAFSLQNVVIGDMIEGLG
ncbi:uncharacterized protein LACBIDRAFT_321470 [Laccaria bicolor S238N-H82]|uniref:Predicted protein n=1 Tax=Laccaria bicolor (strain S238N-H82 / ATCC MYA-4686) TaxID=486041 RepID=B0CT05_LACBS|nr:uncharacterized protein LACBIDRAFT_321470 [Laccaria bicolor S238N-H82]EDR13853.1 predicted protein [Laccaria bicolor S238N-H82]|eukprot:XP_001874412.1 predicted protein [Laccaria bicolor S238N-H82]